MKDLAVAGCEPGITARSSLFLAGSCDHVVGSGALLISSTHSSLDTQPFSVLRTLCEMTVPLEDGPNNTAHPIPEYLPSHSTGSI